MVTMSEAPLSDTIQYTSPECDPMTTKDNSQGQNSEQMSTVSWQYNLIVLGVLNNRPFGLVNS